MNTAIPVPLRRISIAVAAVASLLLLAACSGTQTTAPSRASALSPATRALAEKVAGFEKAGSSYPVPTASIKGVSKLSGETVYYIPITSQAPQFEVTGDAVTVALNAAGIHTQICNGNANPSSIAGCISQATNANAGAIITDAIPYALAANAFAAAEAAGVPVLVTDQIPDPDHPASSLLGYIEGSGEAQLRAVADWIAVESRGKANVLINEATDTPSTLSYVTSATSEFRSVCAGCTVTVNQISSSNFPLIAPSTSSALLKTRGVDYVLSEFEQYIQPTQGGVQAAGKASTVKGATTAAQIDGLEMLATDNFLVVDTGQASSYQGWADADAAIRLMTKTALPKYTIPFRLFTRANVSNISITNAAQASGVWYGPTNFTSQFKKLWGVD